MENEQLEESPRKRPHVDSNSADKNKTVDAAILQYQNQKLVQQLEMQKKRLHELEDEKNELRDNQASYDNVLITVNRLWNQLFGDLILLGLRVGAGQIVLQSLDHLDHSRGLIPSGPAEEFFICRLLQTGSVRSISNDGYFGYIKEALATRQASTLELLRALEKAVEEQRSEVENLYQAFQAKSSREDPVVLCKIDDLMKEEVDHLRQVIGILHSRHKQYADMIQTCVQNNSVDQSEIRRLTGEVEESMAELEISRRKLVNLKMQKGGPSGVNSSVAVNGSVSPEKAVDKSKRLREVRSSIEETKVLAEDRLSELQDAQEDNQILLKQLQDLENELKDDKYIYSSRPYTLLNDQLHHLNSESERYKGLADSLQADRSFVIRKEKEYSSKAESVETAREMVDISVSKHEELKRHLQTSFAEKNDMELKVEEAIQDSGRKDIKGEFQIMASALSKEMGIMKAQLNRWKDTSQEAHTLLGKAQSVSAALDKMTGEQKNLTNKCSEQMRMIKSLKANVEKMQKEKHELQLYVDMFAQQIYDNRDITEIRESEQRAHVQAKALRSALEEHGLELRIKAAKDAEAAYEQRLAAAQAEIADLRVEVDASERQVLELQEAIKTKQAEAETCISEIETVGQAYEDMQMQNQRLLKQVTERDDDNIKLVSESMKSKQAHSMLLSEKQALGKQLQRTNATLESLKMRITQAEEQMKLYLDEVIRFAQEDRELSAKLETSKRELADAEKEAKWLKSAITASEKENEQIDRKKAELSDELDAERAARRRIQEEIAECNKTIAELTAESEEEEIQRLQEEIKECKAILKCGVCFDRPKEVVIVKCYHLFCNPCIQRNLEIRHRKCPACGTAFGQNDVRFVKI